MPIAPPPARALPWFPALVVLIFFFLLGTRSLNEPDEGRYAEIAREMIETGNWLVPQIWYVPHLDKPPLTYWAVAASMSVFGVNEWAVRLPLALAGLSGVWAALLLTRSLAGAAAARWGGLILATSPLYFVMARMLTTDIFLTQFIAWAVYFFWRSWRSLDALVNEEEEMRGRAARASFAWQLGAWAAMAGGFLAKGPVALAVPLVSIGALVLWRCRGSGAARGQVLFLGALAGVPLFALLALPWFVWVWQTLPGSFDFMVKGQVVGHALEAAAHGRARPFYFFGPILLGGFLPWSVLLFWMWRREHWRSLEARGQEGWLLASVWAGSTFLLFSVNGSKLPHYILPMFPALAVLVAMRWPAWPLEFPGWQWRALLPGPLLLLVGLPLAVRFVFGVTDPWWVGGLPWIAAVGLAVVLWRSGRWSAGQCAGGAAALMIGALFVVVWVVPSIETRLKSNQTLKPLGQALRQEWRPGDRVVIRTRLPQGLPFYAHPAIAATNRPHFSGMPLNRVPFEFAPNRERLGDLVLPDEAAFAAMLKADSRVLVVGFRGALAQTRELAPNVPLREITTVGDWEFFATQPSVRRP